MTMKKKKTLFCIFAVLIALPVVQAGCSFKPPVISEFSVKRLLVETEKGKLTERLSVFSLYTDEDGKNDYNSITVIHKETGLSWVLNRDNSSFFAAAEDVNETGQKTLYAGSNKIAYPLGKFLKGEYSLIAEDLSGNRGVKTFVITGEAANETLPFSFAVTETDWSIMTMENSVPGSFSLILLGADKQPLFSKKINVSETPRGNLLQLKEEYADARYIQCLCETTYKDFAFLTKAYTLY